MMDVMIQDRPRSFVRGHRESRLPFTKRECAKLQRYSMLEIQGPSDDFYIKFLIFFAFTILSEDETRFLKLHATRSLA